MRRQDKSPALLRAGAYLRRKLSGRDLNEALNLLDQVDREARQEAYQNGLADGQGRSRR